MSENVEDRTIYDELLLCELSCSALASVYKDESLNIIARKLAFIRLQGFSPAQPQYPSDSDDQDLKPLT